jgi:soluble lytic murein transglycosylase
VPGDHVGPLNTLAFIRWANQDPQAAADALAAAGAASRWRLSREEQVWAWGSIGRAAAWRQMPQAVGYFERGLVLSEMNDAPQRWLQTWPADTLAWLVRAAIRSASSGQRSHWSVVETAVDAMPPELKADPAWQYWRARALTAQAAGGTGGEAARQQAREIYRRLASATNFYGLLAADELQAGSLRVPRPALPSRDEQAQARANPGLSRALRLYELGWRAEGAKEWNYTLSFAKPGGMGDRELLAAADLACARRSTWRSAFPRLSGARSWRQRKPWAWMPRTCTG